MQNKLVFATNNAGKLREVREILTPLGWEVLSQRDAGIALEPEENGTTFAENAAIKARAVYDAAGGVPVIADDSGLCVDALDGAPGVYSARFAPEGKQCEKLLEVMKDVPEGSRGAKFVAVIALVSGGEVQYFQGECAGTIGFAEQGSGGFGYDPVFMYGDRSFAQLSAEEKNAISHRGKALEKLYAYLKERG